MKPPKVKREWEGLVCRTRRALRTGELVVPAGSTVRVVWTGIRTRIEADACGYCGVKIAVDLKGDLSSVLEPFERFRDAPPPRSRR